MPGGSGISQSLWALRVGKFFSQCSETVTASGTFSRMRAVPSPWCTSQSKISTRPTRPLSSRYSAITARSLKMQKPEA